MTVPTLPSWFRDEIVVLRPGTRTDRYGDTDIDWSTATETTVPRCKVNPVAGGPEDQGRLDDREALTRRWALAAPPTADILATDRIRWDGRLYEVEGEPLRWRSPLGTVDHLYVQLVLVEG